jgi:tetrahydromethanopterin S-methyltransferase subunit G
MTEVTNELMYEGLKRAQTRLDKIEDNTRVISGELQAIRQHMAAHGRDVNNIYDKLVGHELRLERIERRLDLIGEPAE